MATDESMASQTEDWLVTAIQAIKVTGQPLVSVFASTEIAPWYGSIEEGARAAADELLSGERSPIVRVRYVRDIAEHLEAGEHKMRASYEILVGVEHLRAKGEARRGDGAIIGTNGIRDYLMINLDNKRPGLTANGRATDKTEWVGSEPVWNDKKAVIMACLLYVDEVPAA